MTFTANRAYPTPVVGDEAKIPADMAALAAPIDADMQILMDRMDARENTVVTHSGNGVWEVTDGLGIPVPVNDLGDGTYQIGA